MNFKVYNIKEDLTENLSSGNKRELKRSLLADYSETYIKKIRRDMTFTVNGKLISLRIIYEYIKINNKWEFIDIFSYTNKEELKATGIEYKGSLYFKTTGQIAKFINTVLKLNYKKEYFDKEVKYYLEGLKTADKNNAFIERANSFKKDLKALIDKYKVNIYFEQQDDDSGYLIMKDAFDISTTQKNLAFIEDRDIIQILGEDD